MMIRAKAKHPFDQNTEYLQVKALITQWYVFFCFFFKF